MSTFNGLVREFPNIRIDYFRSHPGKPPPAAYFLSHVHSDQLLGLESVKMPFVYCSATTKRILLKMEKYPHRINFAKGILEARKQHYRHLKTILRPLPLNTATELELGPKSTIRVTLLDANHCPGAVMFLIEGDGRAIIYTGDIRAEPWWVNSIVQNPILLPYTCGLKRLDCMYLDTTFATHDLPYREFPTKADGLRELLQKVGQCPPETIFYFRAWTLGYENVWIALSHFLQSRVHVDEYQLRIFRNMDENGVGQSDETAPLTGFPVGNHRLPGCLTGENTVRIHSCEPGLPCHSEIKNTENIMWITPIISRLEDGTEVREVGAGGGAGDLYPTSELKLDDFVSLEQLLTLLSTTGKASDVNPSATVKEDMNAPATLRTFNFSFEDLEGLQPDRTTDIPLKDFVAVLMNRSNGERTWEHLRRRDALGNGKVRPQIAPNRTIHFPYSRHSSFSELRHLVGVFLPRDICPCTVDLGSWSEELSMHALFGDLCSGQEFYFDQETRREWEEQRELGDLNVTTGRKRKREEENTQETETQDCEDQDRIDLEVTMEEITLIGVGLDRGPPGITEDAVSEGKIEPPSDRRLDRIEGTFRRRHYGRNCLDEDDSEEDSLPLSLFEDTAVDQLLLREAKTPRSSSSQPRNHSSQDDVDDADEHEMLSRRQARIDAYKAARLCLIGNDSIQWDALPLRSVGHLGHEEQEIEL